MAIQDGAASGQTATRELARFLAELSFDDLPATVVARAKLVVADTVGVALRGSREPEVTALADRLPAGTGARLLRTGFPEASPEDSAFVNATAISFLELDEGSRPTGHPALHVVPAALAAAQAEHRSGQALLLAVVCGYELQSRVAAAYRLRWPVHPHGNLGTPAAVVALGRLAGWDAALLEAGICIGASLTAATSWSSCFAGATARNAYAGISARTAFAARLLAESGFTGAEDALAETFGEILGDELDAAVLTAGLGDEFGIERGYFKFHAACALVHPTLDALADAIGATHREGSYPPSFARVRPAPDEIDHVQVRTSERAALLGRLNRPNQLSAKFSIPHAVAAYLVLGASGPASFAGEALHDPRVRELARRVTVLADDELTQRWPAEFGARVRIELKGGGALAGACANPYGSGRRQASEADLRAKFLALTEDAIGDAAGRTLWDGLLELERAADVAALLPH
jgi:2-methylcitrate dehydratase PrpD